MNVIASICSFNDAASLKRCVDALEEQTLALDQILIVDNRSEQGAPTNDFRIDTSVVCNIRNIGPTGAAATAIEFAQERRCEWLWILDQDSVPESDALEKLVTLYNSLPAELQPQVGALTARMVREPDGDPEDYGILTPRGPRRADVAPGAAYYECDSAVWSGCLFRMIAVAQVGLPAYGDDGYWDGLNIDWGDVEFFHRLRQKRFKILVHRSSFMRHRLGGEPKKAAVLGWELWSTNHPAFRRYLYFRNMTYFWLYLFPNRKLLPILAHLSSRLAATLIKILVLENDRPAKLSACIRGARDGVLKRIHRRP